MAKAARSWKLERASVNTVTRSRPRSNKYRKTDSKPRPPAGSRNRVWVGGYIRGDGIKVHGHYRGTPSV
jgi:hypothetical protein